MYFFNGLFYLSGFLLFNTKTHTLNIDLRTYINPDLNNLIENRHLKYILSLLPKPELGLLYSDTFSFLDII